MNGKFHSGTRPYLVTYGRLKLSELDDSDTTSVVVGDSQPPIRRILSSPGNFQQILPNLTCLSVREWRGETSIPVIFSHDLYWPMSNSLEPPQTRPPQEEWEYLSSCRSWTGQELPLAGLYNSAFLLELSGSPPVMRNPGIINNCQTTLNMRLQCLQCIVLK